MATNLFNEESGAYIYKNMIWIRQIPPDVERVGQGN